jgi:hypothetical protein
MPIKKKSDSEGGGSQDGGSKRPPKLGNPDADPVRIHREYVERRLGGGREATADAYSRAIGQWHRLPGALSTPTTDVVGERAVSASTEKEEEAKGVEPDDEPTT